MVGDTSYLPSEWDDDERMSALFKPLPPTEQRVIRDARIIFWTTAIQTWTSNTNTLQFTVSEVKKAFQRGTKMPLCISDVVTHMIQEGSLAAVTSVKAERPPGTQQAEGWGQWGKRMVTSVPRLLLRQSSQSVSPANSSCVTDREELVDTNLLQKKSSDLYEALWKSRSIKQADAISGNLWLLSEICQEMLQSSMTSDAQQMTVKDVELCLMWLRRQGLATTRTRQKNTFVKLAVPGTTLATTGDEEDLISLPEIIEVELRSAKRMLQLRIDELTQERDELQKEAKAALNAADKPKALSMLRRRRRVDSSLKVQYGALENTSDCLLHLSDARINKETISYFKSSAQVMREMLTGDHSPESVAETMDDLQEVLQDCNYVSDTLSGQLKVNGDDVSDELLEAELNDLLSKNDTATDDVIAALNNIRIPDTSPVKASPLKKAEPLQA